MANLLDRLAGAVTQGTVLFYQKLVSPLIGPRCRYYPTCSAYMMTALRRFGPVRGLALGLARLLRCHPFSKSCLHDPVPERFAWGDLFRYNRRTKSTDYTENPHA